MNYRIVHFILGILTGFLLFTGIVCGVDGKLFFNKFYNPTISKACTTIGLEFFSIYNLYQIFNFIKKETCEETAKDIIDYYVGIVTGIFIELVILLPMVI